MLQTILYIGILILAVPIGFLLKKLTNDEQKKGKKWFAVLLGVLVLALVVNLFFDYALRSVVRLSLAFMIIVVLINYYPFGR
ncbi:MAG: hypothetical protein KKF56_00480 [Nanoarchaeota archaeon]|nr:hypothetical protein [Nanoarchaeota archaeon]